MKFKYDTSYIEDYQHKLVKAGYGKYAVYAFHIERNVSDAEKEANRKLADELGINSEAWKVNCDKQWSAFGNTLCSFMEDFAKDYTIYQYNYDKYDDNYDLFYYSNKGWNNEDYPTYIQLSPKKHDLDFYCEIIRKLSKYSDDMICRVQFEVDVDTDKIKTYNMANIDRIINKPITLDGRQGKIKKLSDNEYGFFKKGAKTKYYTIDLRYVDIYELIQAN